MMPAKDQPGSGQNDPRAIRMAAIAFFSQNVASSCMFGSFSVLLTSVEAKFGVDRTVSSLGAPLVTLAIALLAPVVGVLAGHVSLRVLMIIGALMSLAGYCALAAVNAAWAYLGIFAVLIGPGLCITGAVLPSALVTRWFNAHRGRALGVVNMPVMVAIVPLLTAFVLRSWGLSEAYLVLAGLTALNVIAVLFIIDNPPKAAGSRTDETAAAAGDVSLSIGQLLRSSRFLVIAFAYSSVMASAVIMSSQIVPMATGWGIDATAAAGLLTLAGLAGMAGTLIFGWLADKIGGHISLIIICVNSAVLWAALLLRPPYGALAAIVALAGLHVPAIFPAFGLAVTESLGSSNFTRALGLVNMVALPFVVFSIPLAAQVFERTGSYDGAILAEAALLLLAGLVVTALRPRRAPAEVTPSIVGSADS